MSSKIVQISKFVTLVGAGPINTAILEDALTFAPCLVAVDGGAEMVRKCGKQADFLLGDLDSVSKATRETYAQKQVISIAEQDTTDMQKAWHHIQSPLRIGVGFLGGRADHHMGALHCLANSGDQSSILLGEEDVVFSVPAKLALTLPIGTRVSLYPWATAKVTTTGLRWPLSNTDLSLTEKVSQSNETASEDILIETSGQLLMFLPRQALGAVVSAFLRSRNIT